MMYMLGLISSCACPFLQTHPKMHPKCPDSSVGRASAFGAGGRGFESRSHHTKGVKMVLAGARIKGVVLGR